MTSPILSELLERTTALRALARELVGDARADDIVQEVAIQTLTSPPKRSGPAGGWLATVVRNLASKDRRAERIRHRHEADAARADVAPPDRSAEDADTLRGLTEIVTSLPEPYRGTILARYLREQTPSEIAAATDTPVRTVKTRLQRGLSLLRQRLDERDGDWRAMFVGAFALDLAVAARPTLLSTTMKLTLFAVILLPVGVAVWSVLPDASESKHPTVATGGVKVDGNPRRPAESPAESPAGSPASGASVASGPKLTSPAAKVKAPAVERPLMRIDMVGPAAFRNAFAKTDIGALFASKEGEQLWRPLLAPVEKVWRQWDGRKDFASTRQRVLDYTGRIRVLWMVHPAENNAGERVSGVLAMDADGSTDLAALGGDLSRAMQTMLPDEPIERRVGKHAMRMIGDSSGDMLTIPTVIDGCLVAFFGEASSFDKSVPRCLRALATQVEKPDAPLSLHIDLTQLRKFSRVRDNLNFQRIFGLESLKGLHASVRPNGRHAQIEFEVAFGEGDRGVFAGILPAVDTLPSLLARLPASATPWLTVPFRPDNIFKAVVAAEAASSDRGVEEVKQEIHDDIGLHIDTELLEHLKGEIMVVGDLWKAKDPDEFRHGDDPLLGACVALSLKDVAAFERGFGKLLGHLKGAVSTHDTREMDGVKITRLGSAFVTGVHMAVGQDLFAVAIGEEGVAQLEALVAGGKKGQGTKRPLPAAIERVRPLAPRGLNGLGVLDLSAVFGGQMTLALEKFNDVVPPPMRLGLSVEETQKMLDRLAPLVKKHDLDHIAAMTGYADGRWRLRLLW